MWHLLITMAVHHKHNLFYIIQIGTDTLDYRRSIYHYPTVANLNTMRCDSFVTYCDFSLQGYYLYQRCNVIFLVS